MMTTDAIRRAAVSAAVVLSAPTLAQDDYYDAHVHLTN